MITWVIGGKSGIGQATADLLKEDPDRVLRVTGTDVNVELESDLGEYWRELDWEREHEPIEVVYCAGVNWLDYIGEMDDDQMAHIFDVNVMGFIRLLNVMRRAHTRDVRIVAVSSDAAVRPMRTSIAYCSSKAALNMAVKCAARELAVYGWRVNAVAPGMTSDTDMTSYIDRRVPDLRGWTKEEAHAYEVSQMIIPRRARRNEIADMIRMVLEGPDYLNGEIITVNGGR